MSRRDEGLALFIYDSLASTPDSTLSVFSLLAATSLHRRRRLLHKSRWGKVPPISWQCSEPPSQLEPRWREE